MPVASGYSIQRNEIINLDHRQNREEHTGSSTTVVFFLRSLPDIRIEHGIGIFVLVV